jgi:anthranilate phosphoribosyltransferase
MTLTEAIARVVARRDFAEGEMTAVCERLLTGEATDAQVGALLVGFRMKGETVDELVGATRALLARAVAVPGVPAGAVDTCGTGGDGAATFNVSTAAGLVVAGAGVPVAKHGNRAVSGNVGGADVLEALGVALDLPPPALGECLRTVGFAFLFAPALQPALRHVGGARSEIRVRTLFNLLGPLANPARLRRQLIGVSDPAHLRTIAEVAARLGHERTWVVHGAGGLDELALQGPSEVLEVANGAVRSWTVSAAEVGLAAAPVAALRVGTVAESAARIRAILAGERGPGRDVVCLNAGAALVVAGAAADLETGVKRAAAAIDSGAAAAVLERLVAFTAGPTRAAR